MREKTKNATATAEEKQNEHTRRLMWYPNHTLTLVNRTYETRKTTIVITNNITTFPLARHTLQLQTLS